MGMRWGGSRVKGPDCCHLSRENPGREKKVGERLGRWLEGTEGGGTPGSDPHGEESPTMITVPSDLGAGRSQIFTLLSLLHEGLGCFKWFDHFLIGYGLRGMFGLWEGGDWRGTKPQRGTGVSVPSFAPPGAELPPSPTLHCTFVPACWEQRVKP